MRHARFMSLAILTIVALAACTTAAPGWTYAPAPSATPPPSGAPSASAAASGGPAASGGAVVDISASGIKYEQDAVTVAAGKPFQIQFNNKDAGVPHNVTIHQGGPTGPELFTSQPFNGVATRAYNIPALDAGAYSFVCTVHPTMVGTLTAQ